MGEIILVRHGQASFGADDYDKLSDLGHQQAAWLGDYFRTHGIGFDRIFRGALRRQRETAEGIVAAMKAGHPQEDPRFDEFHYHELQDEYTRLTGTDAPADRGTFLRLFPQIFTEWEEGRLNGSGETYAAFRARVDAAVDAALIPEGRTLIVTSGGVIGATLRRVLNLDAVAAANLTLNIHNASMHRIRHEFGGFRLCLFNASPHLDASDRAHARTYV